MRDLFKLFLVGILFFSTPAAHAESYKVLIIPDNIVTESVALDSYIYDASAEFFADGVATILSGTDFIKSPSVSETRALIKNDATANLSAKSLTSKFRTTYNVDYVTLKKLANKVNSRYILLITSYIDAENYILRRTPWDFLNIPGASVVDPAYKISTYAVLVDSQNNRTLWSNTYYKTISSCENRIITRGASPQVEQLQKIRDYSRYICPQIAQEVQKNVLPPSVFAKESNQIYYDIGNIDNVFTKKYRHLGKEYDKVYKIVKEDTQEAVEATKVKVNDTKTKVKKNLAERKARAAEKKQAKAELEVKAEPIINKEESSVFNNISNSTKEKTNAIKEAVFKKEAKPEKAAPRKIQYVKPIVDEVNYYNPDDFDIKKTRKNSLYGDLDSNRPSLRDYYNK